MQHPHDKALTKTNPASVGLRIYSKTGAGSVTASSVTARLGL